MRRLLRSRRHVRTLALVLVTALALLTNGGCAPPPNGVQVAKNYAWIQLHERGWTSQAGCLSELWQAESGWNVYARNPASGAYGIPQALPAQRMRWAGQDWLRNPATQVRWGLNYIQQRYGGPCNAWRHFQQRRWYVKAAPAPAPTRSTSTPPTPTPSTAPTAAAAPAPAARPARVTN